MPGHATSSEITPPTRSEGPSWHTLADAEFFPGSLAPERPLKSTQVAPGPAFEVPFKETNFILDKAGRDVPPCDHIAWSKPGINPLRDHIAASVGWSVGFNDHTVWIERVQNLFSIGCYPPVNIGAYQLLDSGIVQAGVSQSHTCARGSIPTPAR